MKYECTITHSNGEVTTREVEAESKEAALEAITREIDSFSCMEFYRILETGEKEFVGRVKESAAPEEPSQPEDKVHFIRQGTCYRSLRKFIDLLFVFGVLAAAIIFMVGVYFGQASGSVLIAVVSISIALAIGFLAVVQKQSMLLLVDIADCHIRSTKV